ncbi:MAG: Rpn family recombination-promoting nuclease/putative transposase, partial [Thiohalorhabdaceae bacterium]
DEVGWLRDRMADEPPHHLPGSFIDPAMAETHSDRLFEVALRDGRTAFAYVLIEHKSGPDPATPVQLLGYQQRIWQRYAEQDRKGRAQRYRRLPPIIPLVVYHGRQEWSVPLALLDCIDADEELVALQRDFGYQVRHLRPEESDARLSTDPVLRAGLRALAWAFAEHLDDAAVARLLRDLPEGHPLEQALLRYIARVYPTTESAVYRALETTRPERAEELTMTVAEEWIERGKKEGEA